jgi:hypothetical protein
MAAAMSRQERDPSGSEGADGENVAGAAEWGIDGGFLDIPEALDLVESASADDADFRLSHSPSLHKKNP